MAPSNAQSRGNMESLAEQVIIWNTVNTDLAQQIFAADYAYNTVRAELPEIDGVSELTDFISSHRKAYPEMKLEIENIN